MKILFNLSLAIAMLAFIGCATPKRVATMQGSGTKRVYAAHEDAVWRATLNAAEEQGLRIVSSDRTGGYIDARRSLRPHTLGENVGIWVTPAGPESTGVEVVSRQAGPPVAWLKNWENEIHQSIAANLGREVPGTSVPPRQTYIDPKVGDREVVRERVIISEDRSGITAPERRPTLAEEQRRQAELRTRHEASERALTLEVDEARREALQREVDRLREDIRVQEQRLRDLERELK